ncbi:MAG: hypothetical protein JW806_05075 [Sedimentisphaerales bacterium]|nr:hypothetical protein [Sedimentisphaerales bacterium]
MSSKKSFLILLLVTLALYCSNALAVAPLGPPTANLEKGKYSLGLDYTYSEMAMKFRNGNSPGGGPPFDMDFKNNAIYTTLSRGFGQNWEIFFRGGVGSTRGTDNIGSTVAHIYDAYKGYSLGFGTKWNFCRPNENLKIGGMFQILWTKVETYAKLAGNKWRTDTDYTEMQLAFGPEYKIKENITLFGGGFANIIRGKMSAKQRNATGRIFYDVKGDSEIGGYIGSRIIINENTSFAVEWQNAKSMNVLGLNLTFLLN